MRDINRIEPILEEIKIIWKNNPDLRLGQLLLNLVANANMLYYVEDNDLIQALKEMYNK